VGKPILFENGESISMKNTPLRCGFLGKGARVRRSIRCWKDSPMGRRPEDFPSSVCATSRFQSAFPFVSPEIPPNPKLQALTHATQGIVHSTEP
jgi:hypothetical protein